MRAEESLGGWAWSGRCVLNSGLEELRMIGTERALPIVDGLEHIVRGTKSPSGIPTGPGGIRSELAVVHAPEIDPGARDGRIDSESREEQIDRLDALLQV